MRGGLGFGAGLSREVGGGGRGNNGGAFKGGGRGLREVGGVFFMFGGVFGG